MRAFSSWLHGSYGKQKRKSPKGIPCSFMDISFICRMRRPAWIKQKADTLIGIGYVRAFGD
jgi:hypothetical protein